jgi:hypothetical protein
VFRLSSKYNSEYNEPGEEQEIDRIDSQQIVEPANLMKPTLSRDSVDGQSLADHYDDCGEHNHEYAQTLVQPDTARLDEPCLDNKSDAP